MAITNFAFTPATGFNDTTVYTNPQSGTQARQQLQTPLNQIRDYINNDLVPNVVESASPTLTGIPKAPTATKGTNTTQIATTAFVQNAITPVSVSVTLASASWSSKTYTITNANIESSKTIILSYPTSITDAQFTALANAVIRPSSVSSGSLVLKAITQPSVDIPITLEIWG